MFLPQADSVWETKVGRSRRFFQIGMSHFYPPESEELPKYSIDSDLHLTENAKEW